MTSSSQHVIFRCTPDDLPKWTYYSMPVSCVGGGASLAEARGNYAEALAFHLEVDEAPASVEHTEREVAPGVWARVIRDSLAIGRDDGVDILAQALRDNPDLARSLEEYPTAGGDAVMVVTNPGDLISLLRDQITAYDSVWIALTRMHSEGAERDVLWIPLAGAEAEGVVPDEDRRIDKLVQGDPEQATVADLAINIGVGQYLTATMRVGAPVLV